MKILHVITSLEIGGAQRLLTDMLPIQRTLGNDVELLVLKDEVSVFKTMLVETGITIHYLDSQNIYNPINIIKLIRYIKGRDLVHVHLFPTLYWVAFAALFCRGGKLIYTEHSTHNKRRNKFYWRPIEKFVYGQYNYIISISQQTQNNLIQWLRPDFDNDRFVVIENGVDFSKFSSYTGKVNDNQIIMVSRFAAMKDQETVIRAMIYVDKRAELVLVGDGPNRLNCEGIAKTLGVSDRVHFLGARSDISELVAKSYIGIQSSLWEGFGLTAVEIMAAGKPVVASNVEGLKQVVEGAGLLFEVKNAKSLAAVINNLMNDKSLYRQVASRCRERAQLYDIKNMVERYQMIYEK